MNFDEFCKGSFTKWDGEPPEGVKTWDRERGRFVDPFTMNKERPNVSYSDTYTSCIAKNANVLKKAGTAAVEQVTSEVKKFTEQMEEYMKVMNNGRLSGDISSGYAYEVKTNNPYPNSIQKAFCDYIKHDIESTKNINQIIKKGENTMPVNYNEFFTTGRVYMANVFLPKIKDVIFNPPATIVLWDDSSKTIVKAQNGEPYDPEKGLAMAIVKKVCGNKGRYFNGVKKWTDKYWAKKEAEEEAKYREMLRKEEKEEAAPAKFDSNHTRMKRIFFATYEEARRMLSAMIEVRDRYGFVSIADVCDLIGMDSCYGNSKYGWTSLRGSSIKMTSGGYYLYLPKFERNTIG